MNIKPFDPLTNDSPQETRQHKNTKASIQPPAPSLQIEGDRRLRAGEQLASLKVSNAFCAFLRLFLPFYDVLRLSTTQPKPKMKPESKKQPKTDAATGPGVGEKSRAITAC